MDSLKTIHAKIVDNLGLILHVLASGLLNDNNQWIFTKEKKKVQGPTSIGPPGTKKHICPSCGAKGYKTTLTNNSFACEKCFTWWAGL